MKLSLEELKILSEKLKGSYDTETYNIYKRVNKEIEKKENNWYLVIFWSWSGYSGQNNCYKWVRRSKAIKMTKKRAMKYVWKLHQKFSDKTFNSWSIVFENEKPDVTWDLWWYECFLAENWIPTF